MNVSEDDNNNNNTSVINIHGRSGACRLYNIIIYMSD